MSETVHKFDSSILREYDIRGVVGTTLHVADARAIGRTFGTLVRRKGGKKVALGYDGRLSSPELAAACTEGLVAAGCDVVQIGVAATPMLYFSVYHLEADGGIMITGSHNPPDYNGFKMMMGKRSFFGADITKLGEMAGKADWEAGKGSVEKKNILADYAARLLKDVKPGKKLKVAWDTGNGAVGVSIRAVVDKLPGKHYVLNEKVDGTFPAHHPDPTVPKNLEQLVAEVKRHGCDLGIAFDGDGDRIGAVDGKGRILWGDQLLILWARDVLKDHPGATIIADVKASQALFDEVLRAGGTPLMWKTGHSLIKTKMAELKSPLAGEMSGHVFFADTFWLRRCAVLRPAPFEHRGQRPGKPGHDARQASAAREHAGTALRLRRRPQVQGRRGSESAAEGGECQAERHRRGAREHARWLVAAARLEHPAGAGRALRERERSGPRAPEGGPEGGFGTEWARASRRGVHRPPLMRFFFYGTL